MGTASSINELERFFKTRAEQHLRARCLDGYILVSLATVYSDWAARVRALGRWRRDYLIAWALDEWRRAAVAGSEPGHYLALALAEVVSSLHALP